MATVPTPRERVAANVRAEMARRRVTQADIASLLGLSQQSVSKRLNAALPFDVDEITAVAALFGVPTSTLLGDKPATTASGAA